MGNFFTSPIDVFKEGGESTNRILQTIVPQNVKPILLPKLNIDNLKDQFTPKSFGPVPEAYNIPKLLKPEINLEDFNRGFSTGGDERFPVIPPRSKPRFSKRDTLLRSENSVGFGLDPQREKISRLTTLNV